MTEATSTVAPIPQHMQALNRANEVRLARAQVKRDVKNGQTTARQVILDCSWEVVSMEIEELLLCQHGWGPTRTSKLLASASMPGTKTIGSMSVRQRRALAARLSEDYKPDSPSPNPTPPTIGEVIAVAQKSVAEKNALIGCRPKREPQKTPPRSPNESTSHTGFKRVERGVQVPATVERRPDFREHSGLPVVRSARAS